MILRKVTAVIDRKTIERHNAKSMESITCVFLFFRGEFDSDDGFNQHDNFLFFYYFSRFVFVKCKNGCIFTSRQQNVSGFALFILQLFFIMCV